MASGAKHVGDDRDITPFDRLSDRQRIYLRHTAHNLGSKEIAALEGVTAKAVDKQLFQAKNLIGAGTRAEAARRFVAFEAGVESFYRANILPVQSDPTPLPMPVPTRRTRVNLLKVREVLIWGSIVMIGSMTGLAVAAMLIHSLMLLFGANLT